MAPLFTLEDLQRVVPIVRRLVPETPAYAWPLLRERLGLDIVVKHENHTPTGAFKARSSIVYLSRYISRNGMPSGVIAATTGNHGQSVALAARTLGLPSVIVVPEGNAVGKNRAMQAFGAQLIVAGPDFDSARQEASRLAAERGYVMVPPFHRDIALGVGTYALELFSAHPDLDLVYVPIGMGSGACALVTVRDLLGLRTEIVPVVSAHAPAVRLSLEAGRVVETDTAKTFAGGMACRQPDPEVLRILLSGAPRAVSVSDDALADAIRILFADTHNLAEGAGAAGLAAAIGERSALAGRKVGVILSGGNLDEAAMATILNGGTPAA